jgi:hypothetical protein
MERQKAMRTQDSLVQGKQNQQKYQSRSSVSILLNSSEVLAHEQTSSSVERVT